jgi:anthranilate phosphoribosyltransferase
VAGEKAETIQEGIRVAEDCLDSGAAGKKLRELVELTHS